MITCRQAPLAEGQAVIESFLPDQWAHTGDSGLDCQPNWPLYRALEQAGAFYLLLVYEGERPIGYLAAMLHPHVNAIGTPVATIPTYYIEERTGRAAILRTLFRQAIKDLAAKGIRQLNADTEFEHSAGRLLERLGFRPARIGYKMNLTREPQDA